MNRYEIVIDGKGGARGYWRELWEYRELLFFLAWRETLVRYRQTIAGVAWVIIRPLVATALFTLVFHRVAKIPSTDVPYPMLVLAAMPAWQFFSGVISESGNSLMSNSNLITKVYFPRMLLPMGMATTGLVELGVNLLLTIMAGFYYKTPPGLGMMFLPVAIMILFLFSTGGAMWIAALTARFRDLRHIVPFLLQILLFLSPVGYSASAIPEKFELLYRLNPLTGIIEAFRWSLLGSGSLPLVEIATSFALALVVFLSGALFFKRAESRFADYI